VAIGGTRPTVISSYHSFQLLVYHWLGIAFVAGDIAADRSPWTS